MNTFMGCGWVMGCYQGFRSRCDSETIMPLFSGDFLQSAFHYPLFAYCLSTHSNPKGQGTDCFFSFRCEKVKISATLMDSKVLCGIVRLIWLTCTMKHEAILESCSICSPMISWWPHGGPTGVAPVATAICPRLIAVPLGTARIR